MTKVSKVEPTDDLNTEF